MQTNQKFNNLYDKLRYQWKIIESQLELALLIIVYYLKMRPVIERWSSKYVWFFYSQRLVDAGLYWFEVYKDFITTIIGEFFSVLILKEKVWKSVNQKIY